MIFFDYVFHCLDSAFFLHLIYSELSLICCLCKLELRLEKKDFSTNLMSNLNICKNTKRHKDMNWIIFKFQWLIYNENLVLKFMLTNTQRTVILYNKAVCQWILAWFSLFNEKHEKVHFWHQVQNWTPRDRIILWCAHATIWKAILSSLPKEKFWRTC